MSWCCQRNCDNVSATVRDGGRKREGGGLKKMYRVRRASDIALADSSLGEELEVASFHSKSSDHRPITHARLVHDGAALRVSFRVQDRYVRAVREAYQDLVSRDSCVEFFVQPMAGRGYFNFEWNCGGTMLLFYVEDPARVPGDFFRKYSVVPSELGGLVRVETSLPSRVDPEIEQPVTWTLDATIPLAVFEAYLGPLGPLSGQTWRGNFFKCAEEVSKPHWASWSPIGEQLRFHQPDRFGDLFLE